MGVYTVHEPPQRETDALRHTERFVFVRDGFSIPAFLFGPLWMLRHRMWLVLILYFVINAAITVGLGFVVGGHAGAMVLIGFFLALLIGIEASSLRRWTLARRGWHALAVVVGDGLEDAERRFFDTWSASSRKNSTRNDSDFRASSFPISTPMSGSAGVSSQVTGLFPDPGVRL